MAAQISAYGDCINRYGEELCGNRIEIVRGDAGITAILADGMDGGAKANMLASLAVKMMLTMLSRGAPIEEIADIIAESQPAGDEEGCGHSAFTLIQVINSGIVFISQMETPDVILLLRGKPAKLQSCRKIRQGRVIRNGILNAGDADTLVAVNNGMLRAGEGRNLKSGWKLDQISTYLGNASGPRVTAEKLTRLLLSASSCLSRGKPAEDFSALVFRIKR